VGFVYPSDTLGFIAVAPRYSLPCAQGRASRAATQSASSESRLGAFQDLVRRVGEVGRQAGGVDALQDRRTGRAALPWSSSGNLGGGSAQGADVVWDVGDVCPDQFDGALAVPGSAANP
jgi:hypothetical protein